MTNRQALAVVARPAVPAVPRKSPLAYLVEEIKEIQGFGKYERELVLPLRYEVCPSTRDSIVQAIEDLQDYLHVNEEDESGCDADTLMAKGTNYADDDFIKQELKFLVGAWPNATKSDVAALGALLKVEVQAKAVSRYALAAACRKLRTTLKWLPTIAEILEAIDECENDVQRWDRLHCSLPARLEDARNRVADYDVRKEAEAKERAWRETVIAKAGKRCGRCGTTEYPRFHVFWRAKDKSDAECLCGECYVPRWKSGSRMPRPRCAWWARVEMTELEYFRALIDLLAEHYELLGSDPDERAMARIRRDAATPQLISDDPRILEMIYGCTCSMQGISALDKGISAPSAFGCGG